MNNLLPDQLFDLKGRSVVVSGATGVLGGRIAEALIDGGAELTLLVRDASRASQLKRKASAEPGHGQGLCKAFLTQAATPTTQRDTTQQQDLRRGMSCFS